MKATTFLLLPFFVFAQVGVNTSAPNAMLDVSSTDNGILIPRVDLTSAVDLITVVNPQGGVLQISTLVYNSNSAGVSPNAVTPGFYYWNGGRWIGLGATPDWQLTGNVGTNDPAAPLTYGTSPIAPGETFIGTTDGQDVVLAANNRERFRLVQSTGNIGIGTATPTYKLEIQETLANAAALRAINTNISNVDGIGVWGTSLNNPGYGYGGYFEGGFMAMRAANSGGNYVGTSYGIYGTSSGTAGTRVGGYFSASGGTENYSIVAPQSGGFRGYRHANAAVQTSSYGTDQWQDCASQ